jgi:PAS domain S-box-containing protein
MAQVGMPKRNRWLLEGSLAALPLLVVWCVPSGWTVLKLDDYTPLHSFAEMFAVVVSMLAFANGWSTPGPRRSANVTVVAAAFLAVGLLDFAHLLSYQSMPRLVTPSSPSKAIYFWLAARGIAAAAMLSLPLVLTSIGTRRFIVLGVSVAATGLAYLGVLYAPEHLPVVFMPGTGLTGTKVGAEVVLTALYAAAFLLLCIRGAPSFRSALPQLQRAALLMTLGEIPFALYQSVSDGFNILGHVYKVAAYLFVYRAILNETVLAPHTELHASVEALRESEARFQQLAENIREVFWLRDATTGRMIYLSPAFESLYGRPPEAVQDAEALVKLVHPDDRDALRAVIVNQKRGEATTIEYRLVREDGVRWVRSATVPIPGPDGAVTRVAGIASDVTAEREAQDVLARAERMAGLGRFAGGVAHDFNNLLTVIFASLEMAADDLPQDHPVQREIRQSQEAAARARDLTAQLLSFARQRPGEVRRFDLGQLAAKACAMARPLLGSNVELAVLVEPGDHAVRADPAQLEQVILNLLVNAKDAMPDGGKVVVSVQGLPAVGDRGPSVQLKVRDTGAGMTREVAAHVFDPFFTTKAPGKGTGLGLATSFGIVAQAGGQISVDSEPGRGTTMSVQLAASPGPIEEQKEDAHAQPDVRGTETVLLAEDEVAIRLFTTRLLQQNGYTVLVATNGREALDIAAAHEGPIHLLLSDVVMPLMGGHELATHFVAARPEAVVLLVSGYAAGAPLQSEHPMLAKPYTGSTLLRRIRQRLDGAQSAVALRVESAV